MRYFKLDICSQINDFHLPLQLVYERKLQIEALMF